MKGTSTVCTGGWGNSRASLGWVWKNVAPQLFKLQTAHPLAGRYTNYAFAAYVHGKYIVCIYLYA
jgi:hypothetical protein